MRKFANEIATLVQLLQLFRETVDAEMPMQMAHTFLCVALQPGITMKHLCDVTGLSQSSMSRNIQTLGQWHRAGKRGYDLVEAVEDPADTRRKVVFLTSKGRVLAAKLVSTLKAENVVIPSPTATEYLHEVRQRRMTQN